MLEQASNYTARQHIEVILSFTSNICLFSHNNSWTGQRSGDIAHTSRAAARPTAIPSQNIAMSHTYSHVPFVCYSFGYSFFFLSGGGRSDKGQEGAGFPRLPHTCRTLAGQDLLLCHVLFLNMKRIRQGLRLAVVRQILKLNLGAKCAMRGQGQGNFAELKERSMKGASTSLS